MHVNGRGGEPLAVAPKMALSDRSWTVFLGIKYSAMAMKPGSSIAVTSSQLGLEGAPGNAACKSLNSSPFKNSASFCFGAPDCATKFAVRGLALSAAAELGPLGIRCDADKVSTGHITLAQVLCRVNAVCPGPIETALINGLPAERKQWIEDQVPLGRMGYTQEIATAFLYLSSDAGSFCTATSLKVRCVIRL
jgi:NAD(P)-dependent dehydrogenase (short-subunit alcohol dehydrogenase family)